MGTYLYGWKRTFSFGGNSTRAQFWVFNNVNYLLVYLAYSFIIADLVVGSGEIDVVGILSVALLVFTIPYFFASWSIAVRRLYDSGKSGWCLLLGLIPII